MHISIFCILSLFLFVDCRKHTSFSSPSLSDSDPHIIHDGGEDLNVTEEFSTLYSKINASIIASHRQLQIVDEIWDLTAHPRIVEKFRYHWIAKEAFIAKHVEKILNVRGGKMVFSFTGTSVTAGHDNYYNQSYPFIVEKMMRPIYEALGMEFEVRNIAEGNNACQPYEACAVQWSGDDVDLYGWEHSMNCALYSYDAMQTMIIQANYHGDHPLFVVPWYSARVASDSAPAFALDHTAYEPYNEEVNFTVQHLTQDDKCCGHKSWHPSPHGHELVGDLIAYGLIKASVLPALESLKHALLSTRRMVKVNEMGRYMNTSVAEAYKAYDKTILSNMKCSDSYDKFGFCSSSLLCHTSFEPTYQHSMYQGDYDLSLLVQGSKGYPDKSEKSINGVLVSSSSPWKMALFGTDIGAVLQNILLRDGISDLKWVFQSNVGSISFMVDTVERGPLTVCQCQGSYNSYPKNYDFLERGADIYLNGTLVPLKDWLTVPTDQLMKNQCIVLAPSLAAGRYNLTVQAVSGLVVNVAHILHH